MAAAATDVDAVVALSVIARCWLGMTLPLHYTPSRSIAMLVPQVHLPAPWSARERLSMASWAAVATDITTAKNVGESPFQF